MRRLQFLRLLWTAVVVLAALPGLADTGTCSTASDMDPATRSALDSAAMQIFQQAQTGDYFNLQRSAIPTLASAFAGVQSAVADNKANFQSARAGVRSEYLLQAASTSGSGRTEFFCGVFNSADRVGFAINNLPPGTYAIVIMDVSGGKSPITLSVILQNTGGWKLAGFYARPTQVAGHDGDWYVTRANDYKARGENHNAYFYYLQGWDLLAPVNFMSTAQLDKISDAIAAVKPSDIPGIGQAVDLAVNGKTYRITQMFPAPVSDGLDVVVKYQVPSIANPAAAYQDNMAVIKALVAKYPELREAFVGVVARAVEPGGNDYGSLLAMKDVK
jgi:hypothetical protein